MHIYYIIQSNLEGESLQALGVIIGLVWQFRTLSGAFC